VTAAVPPSPGVPVDGLRRRWVRVPTGPIADPLSRFGLAVLVLVVLVGAIGPLLPVFAGGNATVGPRLAPPDAGWLFGTDNLGRSLLPRVVQGIRVTLLLSTAAVLITATIGIAVGIVIGYVGGIVDEIAVRVADIMFSFPAVLLALFIASLAGPGIPGAVASIVFVTLPLLLRVVRAATLQIAERDFVVTAQVGGVPAARIMAVHLLPNIAGPVVIQATYAISVGMLVESTLSFLGLGVQPPQASLGSLLREGSIYLTAAPWFVFAPGIVLSLTILGVNLVGDGLRDAFEPREPRPLE
jgi:peptide/nickel transport system permease protein